jgi:NDP-sugar pyrophosphorylase family protein
LVEFANKPMILHQIEALSKVRTVALSTKHIKEKERKREKKRKIESFHTYFNHDDAFFF